MHTSSVTPSAMEGGSGGSGAGGAGAGADALQRTLAIVKPDAVAAGKADEILHLAELAGFTVIQKRQLTVRMRAHAGTPHAGAPHAAARPPPATHSRPPPPSPLPDPDPDS